MELVFFGVILLIMMITGTALYRSDPNGWNATFNRISRFTRASLSSGKNAKLLEKLPEKDAKDAWVAQFEGRAITEKPEVKHVIVRTWFQNYGGSISPFWKCKCGAQDWHVAIDAAKRDADMHVKTQNAAEALLARNGGTHAW